MPMRLQDEFARSGKLVLKPWGKIEGVVWIGDRPGADQEILFQRDIRRSAGARQYGLDYGYRTQDRRPGPVRVRSRGPQPW